MRQWASGLVCLLLLLHATSSRAGNNPPNYKLSVGPFAATFSQNYGHWYGGHARLWLLDVTGQRRYSGFFEIINLHWRPDAAAVDLGSEEANSLFMLGRVLRYWKEYLYTFGTVAATAGDPVFPRFQSEGEINLHVPQHPFLVFTVGGGYRYYPGTHRPYMVTGLSYSLARAAFIYRLWIGRGIAAKRSDTHLLTWIYGERLKLWVRADLLFGDETHSSGLRSVVVNSDVSSRGVAVTVEKWIKGNFGLSLRADVTEGTINGLDVSSFRRWQFELRPFWTW